MRRIALAAAALLLAATVPGMAQDDPESAPSEAAEALQPGDVLHCAEDDSLGFRWRQRGKIDLTRFRRTSHTVTIVSAETREIKLDGANLALTFECQDGVCSWRGKDFWKFSDDGFQRTVMLEAVQLSVSYGSCTKQ